MSHARFRKSLCPRMLANSCCRDSAPADSSDRRYFRNFRILHSSQRLREGARPEVVWDNMSHANIDVTQNVYGNGWWGASGCGHPRCRSRNQCRSKCEKEEKKNQPESVSNEWVPPLCRLNLQEAR